MCAFLSWSSSLKPDDIFIGWYYEGYWFLCLFPVGSVGVRGGAWRCLFQEGSCFVFRRFLPFFENANVCLKIWVGQVWGVMSMESQFILNDLTSGSGEFSGDYMGNLREGLSQSVMGWAGAGRALPTRAARCHRLRRSSPGVISF